MKTTSVRKSYVKFFGEEQARILEQAAEGHDNEVHSRRGSDPFKWAVLICIGYQCVEKYAEEHKITVPFKKFKWWCREHGELGTHDGDCDYLTMFVGGYNEYVKKAVND